MYIRCNSCFNKFDSNLDICPFCGYSEEDDSEGSSFLRPGHEIADRYIVGRVLGMGGFGITYKAWDKKFNTVLAIKEYYPCGLANRQPGGAKVILAAKKREKEFIYGKTRFLEEARNMAKFNTHKNIVNVFDYFESNNTAYIVMEYLDGQTLSQAVENQTVPLPYDYCINIASDICKALAAIHKEGIIHRDVSPNNIMLCKNGTVKLFDFGAARFAANRDSRITVVVKPGFAPPEQYDKVNKQDPRTDIYALGATIYYAVTGVKPDESTNRKIEDKLVFPNKLEKTIPQNLSNAIMRAMSLDPKYRFSTADEFCKALMNEKKVKTVEAEKKKRQLKRGLGIIFSLLIIVCLSGFLVYAWNREEELHTLPDASFTWYYIDDETGNTEAAFKAIIDSFEDEYNNVTVNLQGIKIHDYVQKMYEVDKLSENAVFDSGIIDISDMNRIVILNKDDYNLEESSYIRNEINSNGKYPTGIICPVIYFNNTMGTLTDSSSMEAIVSECQSSGQTFKIDSEVYDLYAPVFGNDISEYTDSFAKDKFVSGEIFAFLGCTSDYFDIQEKLPGQYTVMLPDTDTSIYKYSEQWSILWNDDKSIRAAKAFVKYLNSPFAQDYLHSQGRYGGLPIIEDSLNSYLEIYPELSDINDFMKHDYAKFDK